MSIVRVENLEKVYSMGSETVGVLKGVELVVEEGTTVVISGESGSGKTTLLSLVGGLDAPTSGRILVRDRDITALDEDGLVDYRSQTVGFIFQFHFLLNEFTAFENVMMPARIIGDFKREAREKARELLNRVGLEKRSHHYPLELSGGERQRVAVARALMNDPAIILADEPTGNLDERNSAVVEGLLFELVAEYRKTLILVTHDRSMAQKAQSRFELIHGSLLER
jgi:lipoprotein-releasing system ATP-binding protein